MAWPVFPFANLGVSAEFYRLYKRWPPDTLQVLVVGGGGNGGPYGNSAGGGGGGGIRDQSFVTGILIGQTQTYSIVVGGVSGTSSFDASSILATGGQSATAGIGNLKGGDAGSPQSYSGGAGLNATCANQTARLGTGGGGAAYSGVGNTWSGGPTGVNPFYTAGGKFGYTVSPGVAAAIGQVAVGHGGAGGTYIGGNYNNWCTYCGKSVGQQGSPSGAGLGLGCGQGATSGSVYGAGGGGMGGGGVQGVVVVSYPGTQASPSGTVSSYGGYTYHSFTSTGTLEL